MIIFHVHKTRQICFISHENRWNEYTCEACTRYCISNAVKQIPKRFDEYVKSQCQISTLGLFQTKLSENTNKYILRIKYQQSLFYLYLCMAEVPRLIICSRISSLHLPLGVCSKSSTGFPVLDEQMSRGQLLFFLSLTVNWIVTFSKR